MPGMFHERFDIEVGVTEARRRFVMRVDNMFFKRFLESHYDEWHRRKVAEHVASVLGDRYIYTYLVDLAKSADFHRHLQAIEAIHTFVMRDDTDYQHTKRDGLNAAVKEILALSETDIGVRWESGRFIPQGARLLDDKLVNEPLRWLKARSYENVLSPYQKGLQHLLQSPKNPALLADVMTDMYEALEALAKVVTGRDADLSGNRELFISKVKASDPYKRLLKEYIEYANIYRHGTEQGKVRPTPSAAEAENFVYLTGTFIRLAMS